uniref:NADH dehydrogenase subunit 6 n=1 Tax=Idioscopus nitidulus TaxID=1561089 RepID=A0A0U2F0M0_9HEMI|nr:NADH dehydrogenase subunit 6 [Idioscopus nitidulus]AKU47327.1 NADH dehydrogenase subunit 6 [Idioscopus nitidulus]
MKMYIMKTMIMMMSTLPLMKTPMSMGMLLMLQTMLMTVLMNKMLSTSWMPMITFLMMIGGLLILFIYMSSLASNEKFKMNKKTLTLILITMIITEEFMQDTPIYESQKMIYSEQIEQMSLMKLFNKKSFLVTMIMVMYLLLTMIVVTKMVKHYEGPLRSKN